MKNDIAIIIPAYNPDKQLIKIVKELKENNYAKIIVINDGSEESEIFNKIKNSVIIIQHQSNKGKGRALKKGMFYCKDNYPNISGIITVDADGQHQIDDINNVYQRFKKEKNSLILGSRDFVQKNIPFRSKIGNKIISNKIKKKTKVKIKDTQTGLRAIPIQYLKEMLKVEGEGFEYETNMILYAIYKKINIVEVPIKSVYINKNKSSKFNVLKDSIKIYKTINKNCCNNR